MTATPGDVLVCDILEAGIRKAMAERAAIRLTYDTRVVRDLMLANINDELERYNMLVLGR